MSLPPSNISSSCLIGKDSLPLSRLFIEHELSRGIKYRLGIGCLLERCVPLCETAFSLFPYALFVCSLSFCARFILGRHRSFLTGPLGSRDVGCGCFPQVDSLHLWYQAISCVVAQHGGRGELRVVMRDVMVWEAEGERCGSLSESLAAPVLRSRVFTRDFRHTLASRLIGVFACSFRFVG